MATSRAAHLASALARCMPSDVKNAAKFSLKVMEFDRNLNMHFAKHETVYAHDPDRLCQPGDVALIERLPSRLTKYVTHKVQKVVYPFGDIQDPISGKKVVVGKYRDEIEAKSNLYGKNPEGFDYSKAPDRGWQKDKKDFSYQDTYKRYHVFEHDEPYAV